MNDRKLLKAAILSLSMLTIISGAAVSPALGGINAAFPDADSILIQMILTVPAIFIITVGLFFNQLARRISTKRLVEIGLVLYIIGGCGAGFSNSIYLMLVMRAVMGIGVGILMPLSTSLLVRYFSSSGNNSIMGLSFAVNNIGAVISLMLTGLLASIDWRLSFMIYAIGVLSVILISVYMPNEEISGSLSSKSFELKVAKSCIPQVIGAFLTMMIFYIFITNFSLINEAEGLYPKSLNGAIMAMQAVGALTIGLLYGKFVDEVGIRVVAIAGPVLMTLGYVVLYSFHDIVYVVSALLMLGIGIGMTMPMLNSSAASSVSIGKVSIVMGFMSVGVYLGQFFSPFIVNPISDIISKNDVFAPYIVGVFLSLLLLVFLNMKRMKQVNENEIESNSYPDD